MNILIFGATGGTGVNLVTQGLKAGHHITAFVRNPSRLSINNTNLNVIQGDVLSLSDVENSIKSQDLIISVLGNKTSDALWKSNTIISNGVKNIISGMKKNGVRRLLFVASFGVNQRIFLPEKIVIKTILKNLFADIPRQEELIKKSGLDWTIIHPARLVNTPQTGKYKSGLDLHIGLFSKISRSDVADFLISNAKNDSLIGKTITVSY